LPELPGKSQQQSNKEGTLPSLQPIVLALVTV